MTAPDDDVAYGCAQNFKTLVVVERILFQVSMMSSDFRLVYESFEIPDRMSDVWIATRIQDRISETVPR